MTNRYFTRTAVQGEAKSQESQRKTPASWLFTHVSARPNSRAPAYWYAIRAAAEIPSMVNVIK